MRVDWPKLAAWLLLLVAVALWAWVLASSALAAFR